MKGFGKLKPFSVRTAGGSDQMLAFTARLGIFFLDPNAGVKS
jgi:hypothetical protein